MRNKLLAGVAAAALGLTVAGAIAQDSQRNNQAGSSQGATSASPMSEGARGGAASSSRGGEERSAQGQRASEGAGREGAGRNASDNASSAPRNDSATTQGAASETKSGERANPSAASTTGGERERNAQSSDRKNEQNTSAQRNGADAKTNAAESKANDSKGADAKPTAADANRSTGSTNSTSAATGAGERNPDRNNASANTERSGDANRNASQNSGTQTNATSSTGRSNDNAASTRTTSETNRSTASSSSTNVQVRGELDIDRQSATRVHDRLIRDTSVRETNVNINIDVGGRLPDRVRLRPVPADIVEISPRFRNYEYTIVRDEIVIVEPKTKKVVQIISGGGRGGAKQAVRLDTKQRDLVKRDVMKTRTGSASRAADLNIQLREGVEIPDRVTLQTFPEDLWRDAPELREVRYVIVDEDVVLVDPDTREIIEIIR